MGDFFDPVKHFNREKKNWENLFSGDIAKIRPFGLGNEPGTPASRKGQPLTTTSTTTTPAATPSTDVSGEDQRRRRPVGAGTKTLLG